MASSQDLSGLKVCSLMGEVRSRVLIKFAALSHLITNFLQDLTPNGLITGFVIDLYALNVNSGVDYFTFNAKSK